MLVKLVQAPAQPLQLIADIASICYGKDQAADPVKLVKHLFKNGHHSVFEHVHYTFKIEGISRACLAQLTRHRHASYTVRSQRYCNEEEQKYIIPDEINKGNAQEKIYLDAMQSAYDAYRTLLDLGIKKEDARMVLPNATTTELYMSLNLRELLHIVSLRNTKQAQWEIRELMQHIIKLISYHNPEIHFMFEKENA
jgi:thymidylate synthase (FAD)